MNQEDVEDRMSKCDFDRNVMQKPSYSSIVGWFELLGAVKK
jgi:hypothetical protein